MQLYPPCQVPISYTFYYLITPESSPTLFLDPPTSSPLPSPTPSPPLPLPPQPLHTCHSVNKLGGTLEADFCDVPDTRISCWKSIKILWRVVLWYWLLRGVNLCKHWQVLEKINVIKTTNVNCHNRCILKRWQREQSNFVLWTLCLFLC